MGEPLRAEAVCLRYDRRSPLVIDGFTKTFEPGSITLLTGASGTGKSTLLYVLSSLLPATSGAVSHGHTRVSEVPDGERSAWRARHTGFVFQDAVLDPSRSVLDNVVEPAVYAGRRRGTAGVVARELLDRFGVGLRPDAKPGQISGGQAQRVALCRALVRDPSLLFADEPTGNLDDATADVVWRALFAHAEAGNVVVAATHHTPPLPGAEVVRL